MKVVVADTSPLNYLILVDAVEVLPRLYGRVIVPDIVFEELTNEDAPKEVARWTAVRPEWLEVRATPPCEDPSLEDLDAGECAAILLAQRQTEVLLLMDDATGRMEAVKRSIPTVGTLGLLRAASLQGYIILPSVLVRLMATNFRTRKNWWMVSLSNMSKRPNRLAVSDQFVDERFRLPAVLPADIP